MEYLWRPFFNHLGKQAQIFSFTMFDMYWSSSPFDVDAREWGSPTDNDRYVDNTESRVAAFHDLVTNMQKAYKSNHLLYPYGGDFNYANAHWNFRTMDVLMEAFNKKYPNIQLVYSTPGTYVQAVGSLNMQWPTKYDDMFPYADYYNDYWSGYFTSRPNLKSTVRRGSHNLMASTKLYTLAMLNQDTSIAEYDRFYKQINNMFD